MPKTQPSFDGFMASQADGLLRTAFLITADRGEAEDLVQETLLRVQRHWRRVWLMDYPASYARQVLVRLAVRGGDKRTRRRAELNVAVTHDRDSLGVNDLVDVRDALRVALSHLIPRQRTVLVLRYFHDLTEAQVAETLGCSVGTVKSTASRSLDQLRHLIDPDSLTVRSNQ